MTCIFTAFLVFCSSAVLSTFFFLIWNFFWCPLINGFVVSSKREEQQYFAIYTPPLIHSFMKSIHSNVLSSGMDKVAKLLIITVITILTIIVVAIIVFTFALLMSVEINPDERQTWFSISSVVIISAIWDLVGLQEKSVIKNNNGEKRSMLSVWRRRRRQMIKTPVSEPATRDQTVWSAKRASVLAWYTHARFKMLY